MAGVATMDLRPEHPVGQWRGAAMSVLAHGLLLAGMAVMLNWHSHDEPALEAEIWTAIPQAAAPKAEEEAPAPPPQPLKPQRDFAAEQAQRDAEIAIEREKQKRKAEEREREDKQKKAEKDKAEKLAKLEADKLKKEREKEKAQADADKRAQAADEAKREKLRQENLRRMQGLAGSSGGPQSTGNTTQSGGPSAGYGGRINARVYPNITFTDSTAGITVTEVEVRSAPDGLILSSRVLKSGGNAAWDRAVIRALEKTERLPLDNGRIPAVMVLEFKPNQ